MSLPAQLCLSHFHSHPFHTIYAFCAPEWSFDVGNGLLNEDLLTRSFLLVYVVPITPYGEQPDCAFGLLH